MTSPTPTPATGNFGYFWETTINWQGNNYHVLRVEPDVWQLSPYDEDEMYGMLAVSEYRWLADTMARHDNVVVCVDAMDTSTKLLFTVRLDGDFLFPTHSEPPNGNLILFTIPNALDITDAYTRYRKLQLLIDGDD